MTDTAPTTAQSIPVYRAADFYVVSGTNLDDPISFAAELDLDDIFELHPAAKQHRLSVRPSPTKRFTIADDTTIGAPGAELHLDSCVTVMCENGTTTEMLILVEVDHFFHVADIYLLPLAPLHPRLGYSVVGIDQDNARAKFAEIGCVSFTRGTHITMASGEQKPIEDLMVGDQVLTRDDGPQKIHWIGHTTVRAIGDFAPIRIKAGALHNENDLVVSPDHRLFIYQRTDILGAGRNELMIRARHLINGDTVIRQNGGFIDYFQILFDRHQIIYAEGIAAETLLIDTRTHPALPGELGQNQPAHGPEAQRHLDYEVPEHLLNHPNMVSMLKRASSS